MLTRPFQQLENWISYFRRAEIPVFRRTIEAIEKLRENEDDVSPSDFVGIVHNDPLMTLKVLVFAAERRSARAVSDSETVTSSLVLMGVSPFFRKFSDLSCVEDLLKDDPMALHGLEEVVARAFRAAHFALGFAVHRMDRDAEVIREAAYLHDFVEMLLWCHAPLLAHEIRHRLLADPAARSSGVQRAVLNVDPLELQHGLMEAWRLPELLAQITDHRQFGHPRVRNVVLAVDLARHTQRGWDNAALPDDYKAIGELLNVSPEHAHRKALELDA